MRGRRAKAIRLALGLAMKYPDREYEPVEHTRREHQVTNIHGQVVGHYTTVTTRNVKGTPRHVYQYAKRRLLA